jgi:phenylpropionate dioxygenase-like ring-hydroxylating dioxygenase large terminal subunit
MFRIVFFFLNSILINSINNFKIPSFFNHWTCVGLVQNIDFSRPYPVNIGELPLVIWKNPVDNQLNTCVNICKHMGSKLENGIITNIGNLKCQYHGLEMTSEDKFGETMEYEGKIFWAYKPISKKPMGTPFFHNKQYETSFLEIDMMASLTDSAYNMLDLRHPEFVHNKLVGFGNSIPPKNIQHYYYSPKKVGLSFDYYSNELMKRLNENVNKTNNFHMFEYPTFTWSKVSFDKNNLIIGVNLLPISENKTKWFITICHNYHKSSIGKEIMKMLALTILNQDFYQMSNQYQENGLKKEVIFDHVFKDEEAIVYLNKMFEHYKYPNIIECIDLYKYYKNEL